MAQSENLVRGDGFRGGVLRVGHQRPAFVHLGDKFYENE